MCPAANRLRALVVAREARGSATPAPRFSRRSEAEAENTVNTTHLPDSVAGIGVDRLPAVVLTFEILLVLVSVLIAWFGLYVLYRLFTES